VVWDVEFVKEEVETEAGTHVKVVCAFKNERLNQYISFKDDGEGNRELVFERERGPNCLWALIPGTFALTPGEAGWRVAGGTAVVASAAILTPLIVGATSASAAVGTAATVAATSAEASGGAALIGAAEIAAGASGLLTGLSGVPAGGVTVAAVNVAAVTATAAAATTTSAAVLGGVATAPLITGGLAALTLPFVGNAQDANLWVFYKC